MEGSNSAENREHSPRFSVRYLGSMPMDRLYPQSMQPLVMAEVRRKKDVQEVSMEITGESLLVYADTSSVIGGGDDETPDQEPQQQPLLEHHLSGLTRFAKLHQDPLCFAYLTRYQLSAEFECHVFMASSEEIIPQLFKAIREASKDIHAKPPQSQTPTTTASTTTMTSSNSQTTTVQQQSIGSSPTAGSIADVAAEPMDQSNSLFEVKYLGRIKVANKRVTAEYIDQVGEKMIAREEDLMTKKQKESTKNKKRHPSDNSIKSLPDDLDDGSIRLAENNLVEQKESLNQNRGLMLSLFKRGSLQGNDNDSSLDDASSNEGSSDNITGLGAVSREGGGPTALHVDFRSDSDGSREKLDEKDTSPSSANLSSSTRRRHASALDAKRSESPLVMMQKTSFDDSVLLNDKMANRREDPYHVTNLPILDSNRTMLLQISNRDISLVSLERKLAVMERNFKDISFVSQGSHKQDLFGIVARDSGCSFMCYILQCFTDSVVAEIMGTLQMSFSAAFKKQGATNQASALGGSSATSPGPGMSSSSSLSSAAQHQCQTCPMHQLHRLCQEIHSLSPQAAHDLLVKKIHNLPEMELNKIRHQMQAESPESFEESVELMMICLRGMCEYKQREHAHLSVGNKHAKSEINLLEEKHNIFEGLRMKARKSLTTSFENLIHREKLVGMGEYQPNHDSKDLTREGILD